MQSICLLILLLMLGLGCTEKRQQTHSPAADKYAFVQAHAAHQHGKARRLITTSIEQLPSPEPSVILQASVLPTRDMSNAIAEWKLPENVVVIAGQRQTQQTLTAGDGVNFKIELERASIKDGDKIFFFTYQMIDGERHGTPTMFIYKQATDQVLQKSMAPKLKNKKIFQ